MMTPGWDEIKAKADRRIKENGLALMLARDEAEAVKAHREYWAACNALVEFLNELEAESQEPK
jgi:hypothetical protein